jgi:polysaccharide biosynthesis protein PslF
VQVRRLDRAIDPELLLRVETRPNPPLRRASGGALAFGILSTYPPTACGLATFSAALAGGLTAQGAEVRVVRVADTSGRSATPVPAGASASRPTGVVAELEHGSVASVAAAAEALDRCDVAVVQHEYGIYGGDDGEEVLDVLTALRVPAIVVAHTILLQPTPHQRAVLVAAAELADRVVVMSHAARQRLCAGFEVDPAKVITIPHGATVPSTITPPDPRARPTVLTAGLIGPGKGIERVVDAMRSLHDLPVQPRYLVAGQTHPKVLAADGEAYRNARIEQAWRNGVAPSVHFDASYRDVPALTNLIQSATVVVLPYDSTDQVTSGVLVDAVAAGRPVIATAFPHAVELLASGAGLVVDHDDPDALALALHLVLTDHDRTEEMAAEAARLAPSMAWPVVAGQYVDLAAGVLAGRPALV